MVQRGERVIRTPPVETKILEALAGPKAKEIGLHPVPVGSLTARQVPMATPEAEIEIQAKPLNPVQTKENAPGSQGKGKGNPSGTPFSGKGRGRGDGGGPSSGGRGRGRGKGNHRVDQVSGADQVSDADRDYVENALNPADDPFQDEWIDESGCVHNVNAAAGGQNA